MCDDCKRHCEELRAANNALMLRIDQLKHTIRQKDELIDALTLDLKLREEGK